MYIFALIFASAFAARPCDKHDAFLKVQCGPQPVEDCKIKSTDPLVAKIKELIAPRPEVAAAHKAFAEKSKPSNQDTTQYLDAMETTCPQALLQAMRVLMKSASPEIVKPIVLDIAKRSDPLLLVTSIDIVIVDGAIGSGALKPAPPGGQRRLSPFAWI